MAELLYYLDHLEFNLSWLASCVFLVKKSMFKCKHQRLPCLHKKKPLFKNSKAEFHREFFQLVGYKYAIL